MDSSVRELLDRVESVPDFAGTKLNEINDTNTFGDNALHVVCIWGDLAAVELLVENGININQKGEGGIRPLKLADDFGHMDIVLYLIVKGAEVEALEEEFQYEPASDSKHMKKLQTEASKLKQK